MRGTHLSACVPITGPNRSFLLSGICPERAGMLAQHRKVSPGSVTKPEPVVLEKLLRNTSVSPPLTSPPLDLGLVASSQTLAGEESKARTIPLRLSRTSEFRGLSTTQE